MKGFCYSILVIVMSFCFIPLSHSIECLPTCSSVDGRFLDISGPGLSTIVDEEIVVNLTSNGDTLHFGVFDGEAGGFWDNATGGNKFELIFELHADPQRDGSGLAGPVVAFWTGNGSSGRNLGSPMADNNWSDFTFQNIPQAQTPNGDYVYTLRVSSLGVVIGDTANNFKLRANDGLYVPAMFPITFITPITAEIPELTLEQVLILYPNVTCDNETCTEVCGLPPGELCDPTDPTCCFFETTYDGTWSFFMDVPDGETGLDVWDGDLDFGDFNGTAFDTDDPNTPGEPFLPPWSIGTDVVFETARPANPPDDVTFPMDGIFVRAPNIQYLVIDPLGNSYQNFNPSGDREWEKFRLDTQTDNPAVAEYQVDSIPEGRWEVRLIGTDISNLNSILLPYDLRGEIIPEPPPAQVPTLSQWGIIVLVFLLLIIGVKFRKIQLKLDN